MRQDPTLDRLGWADHLCRSATLVSLTVLGRSPVRVQEELVTATEAFSDVLAATGYENPCDYIGSYLCRTVAGTNQASRHAYGVAIDLDYGGDNPDSPDHSGVDRNPHLHRKLYPHDPAFGTEFQLLEHQVRAVESIVNEDGEPIWRWLGWVNGDTMHFDVRVAPDKTEVAGMKRIIYPIKGNGGADDLADSRMRVEEFMIWVTEIQTEERWDPLAESSRAYLERHHPTSTDYQSLFYGDEFITDIVAVIPSTYTNPTTAGEGLGYRQERALKDLWNDAFPDGTP